MSKRIFILLPFFVFGGFLIAYTTISAQIPVDGDGGFHAGVVEYIAKNGTLTDVHPYVLVDRYEHLPLFYPKLFYVEMASLFTLLGDTTLKAVVPTIGIFIAIFIFLVSRRISTSKAVPIITSLVALSSFGLITNSVDMFRMETMVILLGLASIYCFYMFTQVRSLNWFVCSVIFLAACISTKQQAYIILPIFPIIAINKLHTAFKTKLFYTIILFFFSFLLAAPILTNQFLGTGTLFYPGVPFINSIERLTTSALDIIGHETGEGWKRYAFESDRGQNLKIKFSNPANHLSFLNPFSTLTTKPFSAGINILLILGCFILIMKGNLFIVIFLVIQQLLLHKFPIERYYILSQILASMIIGVSFEFFFRFQKLKFINALILSFILIGVISSTVYTLSSSSSIPDYSYGRHYPNRLKATIESGRWLEKNSPKNATVITPRAYLDSYYAKRDSLWLNQLGGEEIYEAFLNNDVNKIYTISKSYPSSYILLPEFWIVNGSADGMWIPFIERETVNKIKERNDYFEPVYDDGLVSIFKVK
ncbi:hypothetical protein A2716_04320 [candidate division WWE3 bacterium RIFCSPHIGHO2_01_FULL_40_23]|uniref:Uncharacterized protein n=1 Tax=candidate division WWE3 bacterium RIFCSPLOWO2_01_FULL_41_18 TaxID=1802625 RepID=A0A1F4VD74_UNCKA|nr:MAG: hypothetical protein A2716_04320 [candidate division WWE3 bacterium RIFCSPHIGHO2_01_FULL_40_23]OGC55099.1 MAG: hypothetical protein A3A78_03930 [candidate division WWE3 bacterium RIFCSPLOWO2_01_FULL_41_18]